MKELAQARRFTDRDNLQALIVCAKAATKWQVKEIQRQALSDLQEAFATLKQEGHSVPKENLRVFTAKVSKGYAMEGRLLNWVPTISLVVPDRPFDAAAPTFGALLPKRTAEEEEMQDFWMNWKACVLNDVVVGTVGSGSDGSEATLDLSETCAKMFAEEHQNMPEYAVQGSMCALKLFRGLAALLDPTPFAAGSSMADVAYVAPLSTEAEKDQPTAKVDFGLAGKSIMRFLAKDTFWVARVNEYQAAVGGEVAHGRALLKLADDITNLCSDGKTQNDGGNDEQNEEPPCNRRFT